VTLIFCVVIVSAVSFTSTSWPRNQVFAPTAGVGDILTSTDVLLSPLVLSAARYEELRARKRRLVADIEREDIPV
jgi:hypothetical protein